MLNFLLSLGIMMLLSAPVSTKMKLVRGHLVLLRHKFLRCSERTICAAQHGHRGRLLTMARINRRRMVAIEFGMCRSGRSGGAPWPITFGNGSRLEQRGGTRS